MLFPAFQSASLKFKIIGIDLYQLAIVFLHIFRSSFRMFYNEIYSVISKLRKLILIVIILLIISILYLIKLTDQHIATVDKVCWLYKTDLF